MLDHICISKSDSTAEMRNFLINHSTLVYKRHNFCLFSIIYDKTDGAYDTKHCRQVILDRDAHAVIPPRKNAKPWKDQQTRSIERNELLKYD